MGIAPGSNAVLPNGLHERAGYPELPAFPARDLRMIREGPFSVFRGLGAYRAF